jgi:hypothetical protein
MVAKKNSKSKRTKSKTRIGKKGTLTRKKTPKKKVAAKGKASKKLLKKAPKKAAATTKAIAQKTTTAKTLSAPKKTGRKKNQDVGGAFSRERLKASSGRQSGDLQGLSAVEGADSESVDELLEEGNAFEADIVKGVEDAGRGAREVRTHEVPEDDVPEEYLES